MFVMMEGLHRRTFIGANTEEIPLDTLGFFSFNRYHIFGGDYDVDDDDYPQK